MRFRSRREACDERAWAALRAPCAAITLLAAALLIDTSFQPAVARTRGASRETDDITTIVVHTVGGPLCQGDRIIFRPIPVRADDAVFWRRLLQAAPAADAHFVIGRDGAVERVIPIAEVAHHVVGANPISIGIELVHRGDGLESFDPRQVAALVALIETLRRDLPKIAANNIVGHDDLDQRTCLCNGTAFRRRQDPGANFPWATVRAAIRLPSDPPPGRPSLTPLVGAASGSACPPSK